MKRFLLLLLLALFSINPLQGRPAKELLAVINQKIALLPEITWKDYLPGITGKMNFINLQTINRIMGNLESKKQLALGFCKSQGMQLRSGFCKYQNSHDAETAKIKTILYDYLSKQQRYIFERYLQKLMQQTASAIKARM